MQLALGPGILEAVTRHARQAYPNEGCGLLAGRGVASRFIPMANISGEPARYEMDPAELIAAFRAIREAGEELVAIYHSHPHGPESPSRSDIERAYYPDAAHLIVSLSDRESPRTAAFRIVDGEAFDLEVHAIV
jgi:[CysO sulfur-carrier protein]-S-L-cysteine hydrolase